VPRRDLPQTLATLLTLLAGRPSAVPAHAQALTRNGTNGAVGAAVHGPLVLSGVEDTHA